MSLLPHLFTAPLNPVFTMHRLCVAIDARNLVFCFQMNKVSHLRGGNYSSTFQLLTIHCAWNAVQINYYYFICS